MRLAAKISGLQHELGALPRQLAAAVVAQAQQAGREWSYDEDLALGLNIFGKSEPGAEEAARLRDDMRRLLQHLGSTWQRALNQLADYTPEHLGLRAFCEGHVTSYAVLAKECESDTALFTDVVAYLRSHPNDPQRSEMLVMLVSHGCELDPMRDVLQSQFGNDNPLAQLTSSASHTERLSAILTAGHAPNELNIQLSDLRTVDELDLTPNVRAAVDIVFAGSLRRAVDDAPSKLPELREFLLAVIARATSCQSDELAAKFLQAAADAVPQYTGLPVAWLEDITGAGRALTTRVGTRENLRQPTSVLASVLGRAFNKSALNSTPAR